MIIKIHALAEHTQWRVKYIKISNKYFIFKDLILEAHKLRLFYSKNHCNVIFNEITVVLKFTVLLRPIVARAIFKDTESFFSVCGLTILQKLTGQLGFYIIKIFSPFIT